MKTFVSLLLLILAGAGAYFLFNSSETPPTPKEAVEKVVGAVGITKKKPANSGDTVRVHTAIDWVTRWNQNVNNGGGYVQQNPIYAFDLPHDDVTQVFKQTGAATFRIYMGIEDGGGYKAALVGVDAKGNDMTDTLKGFFAYDLSTPCPPFCDTTSILYLGPKSNSQTPSIPIVDDPISFDKAKGWTALWNTQVNGGGGFFDRDSLFAFDFPFDDISNIFNESGAATFRMYFGLNNSDDFKAAVVGVDANGRDMTDTTQNFYIFDLSTPCPPFCDTTSVLYAGSENAALVQ